MDRLSIRYLSSCDGEVTREAVDALAAEIRSGSPLEACLALDEYGEEDFLTVDVRGGWAALAYNTWDAGGTAHLHQPVGRAFAGNGMGRIRITGAARHRDSFRICKHFCKPPSGRLQSLRICAIIMPV